MVYIKLYKVKEKLNDIKLRNKLILSFIVVVFIPVIIVGGFLTNELRKLALVDAEQEAVANMERVKQRTLEVLKVPVYISNNLLYDQRLGQIVNTDYEDLYDVVLSYRDYNIFQSYRSIYKNEIRNIKFYTENETLLNNWQIVPVDENVENSDWYRNAKNGKGLIRWDYIEDDTSNGNKYLSLVRKIDFVEYEKSGVLVIQLNTKMFNLILSQESQPTMIVDDDNNIISSNQKDFIGNKLQNIIDSQEILAGKTGTFQGMTQDVSTHILVDSIQLDSSVNHVRIISLIADKEIGRNANMFGKMGLIVVTISVCIALLLIYYISKLLSNRLIRLSSQIGQVGNGNFNTHILIDGKDEIGQLSKQLDRMVKNIKQLLNEVYESNRQKTLLERKQSEIKFKMLASQMNPHFVFNALESIRMKAHIRGEQEIARAVKLLGKLIRNSIEVGSRNVNLISEIEVVRSYLEIQKFRHGDRLNYFIEIDPQTKQFPIPPLIIQPLVENAVIHGVEKNESGGSVYVKTLLCEKGLLVEVTDNGIGISEERQQEIFKALNEQEEKEGMRIGLRNIHQRLQLSYGKDAGLNIESKKHVGTKIYFIIPTFRRS
ncbi:sensor histidine kinase [Metabacillus niabensis]|uniref:histidine kinase n=1 Tax=Metabacillus niabensis TaxID=324854 RepID=A0ABT9YXC3_9BACI|nr:sensor histidine kinase [Metabacillus niabensis]MDQ0223983.1 two-component system sensor histidine kinase YesM [Metabacillus niabensis]